MIGTIDNLTLRSLSSEEIIKIEEFRKSRHTAVLVILFSDIVNSTYATETLGEQSYSKLRHIHDELFKKIVCRENAGIIIKEIGDSFLCVFSEPSTAVLRAIAFQRAIHKNIDHFTVKDYTLRVRIGIHLGQVVVEDTLALDIFGSHVNRAARIEAIGNGGQILTSHSIWENAVGWLKDNSEEEIGWISYGKAKLKGIDGKIEIFGFYPNEIGPSPVPKIFRRQRRTRTIFRTSIFLFLISIGFFLVKYLRQKNHRNEISAGTPGKKSFYVQFDFSQVSNLDTSSIKAVFLSQLIAAFYPDSVITESELISFFTKQGKLFKRHEFKEPKLTGFFKDSLHFQGALYIDGIKLKNKQNDSLAFKSGSAFWTKTQTTLYEDTLLSSLKDLKGYFHNWIQDKLTEFRLNQTLGIVLESNDSILLFRIDKEATLSKGAVIRLVRSYSKKEGLVLWLQDEKNKIDYLKDKPKYREELGDVISYFKDVKIAVTDDLTSGKSSWDFGLNITGKVLELYDSIGKASWSNNGVFPFVKPRKGDLIYLDY